ncbi:MAG: hypothetical protein ACD_38C00174G0003 [uncultured bacterium]|uniref:Phosphoenolpyruvate synthase n=1 Tax=Candidatus Daviesbacteria bacterium GW2011_GWC2_40_12 TaxID=1618431 RepID=A0A0G0QPL5_9BACT|nr:MAG: hypothetical protein ACD_38C00174G0003 [uncultured bacterium]KKQ85803.1 MAG: Phosphoenolpyruvate synthase [Candidatus Daviesbacteria bacterium GW2011_GWF2_38_7]KKR16850.1 MAG: Phosphoenolpyruvate synthase [Candidatus Daviesbacteria bacterium GW2011_GWA2_39_33]KKR42369.1 MAG: Phosphoenolpyruvate synthase [Candidatus Daviesbacteria bacterium GW2011_GWC2_40_12]OGE22285.1 MAG: hypothetical protein A2778_00345 [Candidatus Daviesbacteria bacterium RIFCSPHIGHO2_01_FULL_40_24]OGE28372.1 MAG: h
MIEILPLRVLTDEDTPIFGALNVALGKIKRSDFPVCDGIVINAPCFKLKAVLEHFDFGSREVFEQSLTLVKKEISSIAVPAVLEKETKGKKGYFLKGKTYKSVNSLWSALLSIWIDQIKQRLWNKGFYEGITENLEPLFTAFVKKVQGFGSASFDQFEDDTVVLVKSGKLHPSDYKKISDLVTLANKKLFIPHEYEWVIDAGVKFVGVKPHTPNQDTLTTQAVKINLNSVSSVVPVRETKSTVKVFFDLSSGFAIEKNIDGVYIASEKIFDLNLPSKSFDNLVFKIVEAAVTFPSSPVFLKLADKSEGMGKIRGALRLLHQKNLFEPLAEAVSFARHKKGLVNVHIVIPFVRGVNELLQIKRDLAVKKLSRKNSLQLWMEVCVPENIINMEEYLLAGIDGVVLNLNEQIAHLNGFDPKEEELSFYKNEVEGLIKFLEDPIRLLHKSKIPFIVCGSMALYPKVLEFLVEKGVWGIVVERFEAHSIRDLLHQTEKRMILRRM